MLTQLFLLIYQFWDDRIIIVLRSIVLRSGLEINFFCPIFAHWFTEAFLPFNGNFFNYLVKLISVVFYVKCLNLLNYLKKKKKSEFYTVTNKILSTSSSNCKGGTETAFMCIYTDSKLAFMYCTTVLYNNCCTTVLYNNCINVNSLHKVLIIVNYECCSIKRLKS